MDMHKQGDSVGLLPFNQQQYHYSTVTFNALKRTAQQVGMIYMPQAVKINYK